MVDPLAAEPFELLSEPVCFGNDYLGLQWRRQAEADEEVPCDQPHTIEAIAIADLDQPPTQLEPEARLGLYARCGATADSYLGMAWRATYTSVTVSMPDDSAWESGERWLRCDLFATDYVIPGEAVTVTGLLRDEALPVTCISWSPLPNGGGVGRLEPADCSDAHNGELVATFPALQRELANPDPDYDQELLDRCRELAEDFNGADTLGPELGIWILGALPPLDQHVSCFVLARDADATFTGSLQG